MFMKQDHSNCVQTANSLQISTITVGTICIIHCSADKKTCNSVSVHWSWRQLRGFLLLLVQLSISVQLT